MVGCVVPLLVKNLLLELPGVELLLKPTIDIRRVLIVLHPLGPKFKLLIVLLMLMFLLPLSILREQPKGKSE